ncbi:DHA1 family bicyclomycin/chloramphenicol resistance-like MFS transporter [Actinopolyspora biskrensis]|uniref:DHA1 family bicyclomycin/chloramphenicol resistance-like MFS transporter n=1 Tax=Actinopolyspora biskrensis TaxID=1470178 RepID=A0A852Z1T8_9ACTN|nr:DHA1 family bicyclomycin/chloramphenicol resistance-like MFS transporter [Actinopolyspora biskrensis]
MHPAETRGPHVEPPRTQPPRHTGVLITVLAALSAVSPLATDMYVPGFPQLSAELNISSAGTQLSLTMFLLGLVVGQLFAGPLSDGLGRRRPLLVGSALFAACSAVCALAQNALTLDVARLLEGFTGAVGMVIARAVISDWYSGPAAARHFSVLSVLLGIAPVAAPVLGGVLVDRSSWRVVFWCLTGIGIALLLAVWSAVPESLPPQRRRRGGLAASFASMRGLLTDRTFMGYVATLSCAFAAMFTYISGSSFVFQDLYGVSPTRYSLIFGVNALAMLVSSGSFGALTRRVRMNTVLTAGVALGLVATLAQLITDLLIGGGLITTWIFLFVTMLGMGAVLPGVMAIGQSLVPHAPGSASALIGAGQFLLAAVFSPLVGATGGSALPMATLMLAGFCCAALALLLLARPWRGAGEHLG